MGENGYRRSRGRPSGSGGLAGPRLAGLGERGHPSFGAALAAGALLALSVLAALALPAAPADAFPGQNGRIACDGERGLVPPTGLPEPVRGLTPRSEIYTMNPDGTDVRLVTNNAVLLQDIDPAFSADGRRIAYDSRAGLEGSRSEIHTIDADGTTPPRRVTFSLGNDERATWSPDGTRIAFQGSRDPNFNIFTVAADGFDPLGTRLTSDPAADFTPAWSPDGARIAFDSNAQNSGGRLGDLNSEVYTMNAQAGDAGPGEIRKVTSTDPPVRNWNSNWSPDGSRIVFQSTRDGLGPNRGADNWEIYTVNADGSDVRRLTNNAANDPNTAVNESLDENPAWSPDGTKIVFDSVRSGDREVYTMNASDGAEVRRVTDSPGFDGRCDWGPVPRPAAPPAPPAPPRVGASNVPRACVSRSFRVRVRSDSAAQPQRVTVSLDGRRIRTTGSGSFLVRVPANRLRPGRHRLTVVATDAAGNRTTRTFTFRVCAARRGPRFAG